MRQLKCFIGLLDIISRFPHEGLKWRKKKKKNRKEMLKVNITKSNKEMRIVFEIKNLPFDFFFLIRDRILRIHVTSWLKSNAVLLQVICIFRNGKDIHGLASHKSTAWQFV